MFCAKVAERGISGTEVVEGDGYAQPADALQRGQDGSLGVNDHRLGQFEFERARRQTRALQRRANGRGRLEHFQDWYSLSLLAIRCGRSPDRPTKTAQ